MPISEYSNIALMGYHNTFFISSQKHFGFSPQKHNGYSTEVPQQGPSNEFPKCMFLCRNKKNIIKVLLLSAHNICLHGNIFSYFSQRKHTLCFSLEALCYGSSNEYPQHVFSWSNKTILILFVEKKKQQQ